ncbi:kelch repeat and BTB domain-containing protein 2-like [Branchiostoma floridae]|uniref:Kelch repeat and BTB domain-containing protein 2-like n=1 Tax=Branchiostoma floridae TaxID=7739 RepID=A0A9J7HKN1_BRAFL|nr:kelch repeat and BTB domain-containing protein 2-like [Branchiostoma floridae]
MAAADHETHSSAVRSRSYKDESYLHGFLGTVCDLQKDGVLQDVVLETKGRRFPCHRLVLSAASPYFRAMFTSDMAESWQKTVVLQGMDACMFGEILSYIYSGTIHVSMDKVQPLYQAADLLQLDYVRDTCCSYMAMNVERSTCVDLYKFADVSSVDIVRKCCLQWITRNFTEVASSEDFFSLSVNQLTEIISHDELDVKEETTVWEAVVRWVQHSREGRLDHLPSILPHIRFNLLTSDDTAAILEHPLVNEDPGSSEVMRNVVQTGNFNMKPRLGMTMEMVMLSDISDTASDDLLYMNPQNGMYITCSYDYLPDSITMTVTNDNNIYKLENEQEDYYQLSMFKYNHAENVFEHAGMSSVSMFRREYSGLSSHWDHFLVEVDQILYYGAADLGEGSASVRMRKYNRHSDKWEQCSQLKLEGTWRFSTALSCGPHLYILMDSAMYRYDPRQDCWCKRAPPNITARYSTFTTVAMGTEIFCSDFDFTQTMVYDSESDRWQKLQGWPNLENRSVYCTPSLFVLENELHILLEVYGKQGPSTDYLVYVYDRATDAWRDLKAILPNKEYYAPNPMCPVVRMYLPYLKGAQKHITSYAYQR